jgi:uncharacterized integral membrane protein
MSGIYCQQCDDIDISLKKRRTPCLGIIKCTDGCGCCGCCCCCLYCPTRLQADPHLNRAFIGWWYMVWSVLFVGVIIITPLFAVICHSTMNVTQVDCTTTKIFIGTGQCTYYDPIADSNYESDCPCAFRRIEWYLPSHPPPSGQTYGHYFSEGNCGDSWTDSHVLDPIRGYLNRTDKCWVNGVTGSYFESQLVYAPLTPIEARNNYIIIFVILVTIWLLVLLCNQYCKRMNTTLEHINDTRSQRHAMHSSSLNTFLLGLHPKIGGKALKTFVKDPLYDHRIFPKLISSFAFPEVANLSLGLERDGSYSIGVNDDQGGGVAGNRTLSTPTSDRKAPIQLDDIRDSDRKVPSASAYRYKGGNERLDVFTITLMSTEESRLEPLLALAATIIPPTHGSSGPPPM